ncbi:MAG: translation initiation factor IF-2 [Sulfurimonas sp.]|jgi:translation initiation factor IF-2|nr:translation initiation factor IF-2 [Sulfurimonadaceae bacterium]
MSDKVRISEVAKELGITAKETLLKAQEMGLKVKAVSSSVSMSEAEGLMDFVMNADAPEVVAPTPKKTQVKKDEPKKDEPPKKEIKKQDEPKKEPLKEDVKAKAEVEVKEDAKPVAVAPRPSGLRIVKKKHPREDDVKVQEQVVQTKSASTYGKLSVEALEELSKKKKPKTQSQPTKKSEQGTKIDIFGESMAELSMDMDGEQVVLLDLNQIDTKDFIEDEPRRARPAQPVGRNAGKKNKTVKTVAKVKAKKYKREKQEEEIVTHVEIPEDIRVYEFADKIKKPLGEVIKVLFSFGVMKMKNDFLNNDEISILSEDFGIEVDIVDPKDEFDYVEVAEADIDESNLVQRPPVITIMGHVDHGKTSLLDAIRSAKIAQGEAGGITQHIGAYTIEQNGKAITFLDTPGHAAFASMRQRGTDVTDIIIIVVAADDGVKAQTIEVINMAKESKAPIIVAMTKMDKESANPDMLKAGMAEHGLNPVDWGGDIEFIGISSKTGMGIDELLENILLTAEVMELKADPKAMAKATVVESSLEKGRGAVATVIVQNGTLKIGDYVVCGSSFGRVKALMDENQKQIKSIGPSHTAVVVGLNEVPASGEIMVAMSSDKEARAYAQKRHEYDRHKELSHSTKSTLDDMTTMIAEGRLKALKIVLKADVHGTLEAIRDSLSELRNDEVKINIISSGVGGITENDVELVAGSENCVLVGFNVRPTGSVRALAKQKNVDIRTYSIIYQLIDDMTMMLTGMMAPKFTEENTGQADVRDVFKSPKGMVAGCLVVDGKLIRGGLVRVIRNGVVVHEGELTSLKRFKDDVNEVGNGFECGVMIKGYDDVVVGDVIETFKKIEQKVTL